MAEKWARRKKTKLPTQWTSNIPKEYKRKTRRIIKQNYIKKRILSNFVNEVTLIRNKFEPASYPMRFANSVIRNCTTV